MKKTQKYFMQNRQVFMAGGREGQGPEGQGQEVEKKATNPVADAFEANANKGEQLKSGPETKYEAKPFTKEELEQKSKGYPEVKPAAPSDILSQMKANFKKERKEKMDHGDTSTVFIDEGKGEKEWVILMDKSGGKENVRLFKQA